MSGYTVVLLLAGYANPHHCNTAHAYYKCGLTSCCPLKGQCYSELTFKVMFEPSKQGHKLVWFIESESLFFICTLNIISNPDDIMLIFTLF